MLAAVFFAALSAVVAVSQAGRIVGQERLRPPDSVACSRSELTLYAGRVTDYERHDRQLRLTIATDWDTEERLTLRPSADRQLEDEMLLRGRRFTPSDWRLIEARPGRLRQGVRVAAWVCEDTTETLLDWQPPREGGERLGAPHPGLGVARHTDSAR